MLYRDYSRKAGEWVPNEDGSNHDRDAISFLQQLNRAVYGAFPDVQTIAEESTAWGGVSRPPEHGGLGFGFKWDLGWMHDTLKHVERETVHRKFHYDELTFRAIYANSENYVLPLSHDEVVHGKGSLISKIPGDPWQRYATLRLLYGYQWTLPGKKLLFMGDELGVWNEWNHDQQLDWGIGGHPAHAGIARWVGDLNGAYRAHRALHVGDCDPVGFQWLVGDDREGGVLAYLRTARRSRSAGVRGRELHAGPARWLSARGATRWILARDPELGLGALRWQRHRQPGWDVQRWRGLSRLRPVDRRDRATARHLRLRRGVVHTRDELVVRSRA